MGLVKPGGLIATHNLLSGRGELDSHPITAITSLDSELTYIENKELTNSENISELITIQTEIQSEIETIKNNDLEMESNLESLQENVTSINSDVESLKISRTSNESDISDLKTSNDLISPIVLNNSLYLSKIINKMQNGDSIKIVCYGDSTTWGDTGLSSQTQNPYPSVLQSHLRLIYKNTNITVLNNGHPGQQSDEALSNFDSEITPLNPDLVILMYGINDISGYVLPTNSIDTYKNNIIGMVKKCISNNFKVMLLTPTFTRMINLSNSKILQYGDCVKEISKVYNLPFIDMHKEQEKLYQSGSISISSNMNDGAHMSDIGYKIMADIIARHLDINGEKALTIDSENTKYIPAVSTKYIKTDCNAINTNGLQLMYENYLFTKNGELGSYLSLEFYVNQSGMDLILFSPKSTGGGKLTIVDNGVNLPNVVNFYSEENVDYDSPSIIAENLTLGYHKIELKIDNLIVGDATSSLTNYLFYVSYFLFKKNVLKSLTYNDISITNGNINFSNIEKLIPIINNNSTINYNSSSSYSNILLRTENFAQLKAGKKLIIEMEGYLFDKFGMTWFGNLASNENTLGIELGYFIVFQTNNISIFHSGIGGSPVTFTNSIGTLTLNYSISHKIRIEHSFDGQIKVYIDGSLVISCSSKYHSSGYFGLYNQPSAGSIANINKFSYTYI